jgi:hypothetical protein
MPLLNMMNTRVGPYFDRCLAALEKGLGISLVLFSLSIFNPSLGWAEEEDMAGNPDGLVEVHIKGDPYAPYVDRRTPWSGRLNMQWESFYPSSYISPGDQAPYSNIFGNNQGALISLSLGGQYNTGLGALYVDATYGAGTIPGIASGSALVLSKYGAIAGILLDKLFANPWVSPFVAVEAVYFKWNETAANVSGTTAVTVGTMAGISIHMNRVDEVAAAEAYINYGIKNSFVDIYAIQYNTSNSAGDPDLQTSPAIGAGFHLEF